MVKEQKETRQLMDKRLIEQKLLRGQMIERELSDYIEALPDVAENAEEVIVEMETRK
jgi:hypothetical protein